jgi:hypothetical protein
MELLRGKVFFLPVFFSRRVMKARGWPWVLVTSPTEEPEEVGDAQGGVDAQHEEQPVSLAGQEAFHGPDFFRVPDRFDEVHDEGLLLNDIIGDFMKLSHEKQGGGKEVLGKFGCEALVYPY